MENFFNFLVLLVIASPVFFFYRNRQLANRRQKKKITSQEAIVRDREANPDELALGYAEGEDDETGRPVLQLKGVPQKDRDKHFYVVGGTGSGKTKFLESIICQDINNGVGFGVIDPHGDLVENIKGYLFLSQNSPESGFLKEKVILIDPTDENLTVGFNPLETMKGVSSAEQAGELVLVFKKIWQDSWGARMQDILSHSLVALIEARLTLADLHQFLTDADFRARVMEKVTHAQCKTYFENFNSHAERTRKEWTESTLNKVHSFMLDERIATILSAPQSTFNLREIIDSGKILLIRLDKGRLKGLADLLGSLLLAKIQMAAFSRTDQPKSERRTFYLYIDEFQNFATENFVEILAEARKYGLVIVAAHQHLTQLPAILRDSILTNCGLQAYFRLSRSDAQTLSKEALTSIYAQPPGWEELTQLLQDLPPRVFAIKNKTAGGAVLLKSLESPDPHDMAKLKEREFKNLVAAEVIGENYLRERSSFTEAHEKLLEELLEETDNKEGGEAGPQTFDDPVAPATFDEVKS